MRGVVFTGERQLELMQFPDPTPGEGEVVIEMKASSMCGSDLHQYCQLKGTESIGGLPVPQNRLSWGTSRAASLPRSAPTSRLRNAVHDPLKGRKTEEAHKL